MMKTLASNHSSKRKHCLLAFIWLAAALINSHAAPDHTLAPGDFGAQAARIGFDNLAAGATLTSQLRVHGLRLRSDDGAPLTVLNAAAGGVAPLSLPFAAGSSNTAPAFEIRFDFPRRKVGLYFARPGASGSTRAVLQALDASGLVVTQAAVTVSAAAAGTMKNFIGTGVSANVIRRVKLTFEGAASRSVVDDLLVEPAQAELTAEAVAPLRGTLESIGTTREQKLDAIRSLQLLPSPAASQALQAAGKSNSDLYVRERAIHGLTQLHDPAALPALVEIGLNPANADLRRAAHNAVWALRREFPMPDPPQVTVTALAPPKPGEPYPVEARVTSPVDRPMVQIKFKSSKQAQAITKGGRTQHYVGPMRAGQTIVLRADYIQTEPGMTQIPLTVRVNNNAVDGTTYETPLYVDAQVGGGTASMIPFPGWRNVKRHIVPLSRDPGAPRMSAMSLAGLNGSGERNTVVEGFLSYADADTMANLGFTVTGVKPSRQLKVKVVESADSDEEFGEGWTDGSGFFSIPVEDVPDNVELALLLEVDNYVTKLYLETDVGDEEFIALTGSVNAGTSGAINIGSWVIPIDYRDIEVDENGDLFFFGGETTTVAFASAMNINEVILVTREDMDNSRDPREGDTIGQVDVEYGDEAGPHYFLDLVLTGGRIDGAAPSSNPGGLDFGLIDSTIAHEYAHHLQYEIGSWDAHEGEHNWCEEIDSFWWNAPEFAWAEGFASYLGTYIAATKPGMSQVRVGSSENICPNGVLWRSLPRSDEASISVEGHVVGTLWDLSDGWGAGDDLWDQVDGNAINGHRIILQIFDHELGDSGFLWGLFEDAPDLRDFYWAWAHRFSVTDFQGGKPVLDPILNRMEIVPGGEVNGTLRKERPFPVIEGLPMLPTVGQASLVFNQTNAHTCLLPLGTTPQYDPPIPASFAPGQPVLTIRRQWSYLDAQPAGTNAEADTISVRVALSNLLNLGGPNMEVDDAGSVFEASQAAYTTSVQYGPGATGWLNVNPASSNFLAHPDPRLQTVTIQFDAAAFDLAGGREYTADIILDFTVANVVNQRIIRIILNQLNGPNDDCDGDGLTNERERALRQSDPLLYWCLDPRFADSDADGLRDGEEIDRYGTLPCNPDTDADGFLDGTELAHCFNPLVADADADADGDGLTNAEELSGSFHTDPCDPDSDEDGALDGADNCRFSANPDQTDIDGDGLGDFCDWDMDGDGCANLYDGNPADVQRPDTACLIRPSDPALTREGRLVKKLDPRLGDPRWQMLLDGIRPNGPDSCAPVSCPPPSAMLIDPSGNPVRAIFANEFGFDQRSGFATVAELLPDLDGDGMPEIALAAPNVGPGEVILVSGKTGRELGRSKGQNPNARYGSALALMSATELAIGAPGTGETEGAVHLLRFGSPGGQTIKGGWAGDRFGAALVVGAVGSITELAIGAPGDRGRGGVYAWNAQEDLRRVAMGLAEGDEFGTALAWADDLTRDGRPEVLVGAPGAKREISDLHQGFLEQAAAVAEEVGEVTLLNLDGRRLWSRMGGQAGERFGAVVAALPGSSAGNSIRFMAGAPGWQNQMGRACFLAVDGQIAQIINGTKVGGKLGAYVGLGPDLDGDGEPSFVVGQDGIFGSTGVPGISTILQAFVRPHIKSIRRTASGRFELRCRGERGVRYELHATTNLATWEKVGSVLATGDEDTLTINSTVSHRFYRLRAQ